MLYKNFLVYGVSYVFEFLFNFNCIMIRVYLFWWLSVEIFILILLSGDFVSFHVLKKTANLSLWLPWNLVYIINKFPHA